MKIIIVGAGLAGLSTAISLRRFVAPKHPGLEIKIFEKAVATQNQEEAQGAALGLQENGLKALKAIDGELHDRVKRAGFPCTHFTHKTDTDYLLGKEYINVLPVSRPLLIKSLFDSLREDTVIYKTIVRVVAEQGKRPRVVFEDGTEEIADLIIGADGVRSTVRNSLFGDDEKYRPVYQGICAVGGILDIPLPQHLVQNPSMIFFLGATGVFGYSGLTQSDLNKLLFWSVYQTDLPDRGAKLDHALLTQQLKERHGDWADPIIRQCLENATIDTIYPIFVMPDLPYWGRDGCLLIGDAAHALPPRSGQGSSQAFEDALTLGLLLSEMLSSEHDAVNGAVKGLYDLRHVRVKTIKDRAMRFKDPKMPMSVAMKWFLWTIMFVLTKITFVTSFFSGADSWNAEDEVRHYVLS